MQINNEIETLFEESKMKKCLPKTENIILIPIYNEQKHIFNVLREVRKFTQDDIIVINDGSTDESQIIVEEISSCARLKGNIHILSHLKNEGYGQSLIDGIAFANKYNYKYLFTLDCDEQHEPELIPKFLKEIKKGKKDIVSGSRYFTYHEKIDNPPKDRFKINLKITKLINQITGFNLTDSFCGFKVYHVKALKKLKLTEKGYGFPLQLWIQAYKNHLKVKELAVNMIYLDKNRTFGGHLDNPKSRLRYYMEVIDREVKNA